MKEKKTNTRRVWVDPDDAPEWTDDQWDRAEISIGGKVVRLSQDVLAHFRKSGPGWQTRIDETLRRSAKLPAKKP